MKTIFTLIRFALIAVLINIGISGFSQNYYTIGTGTTDAQYPYYTYYQDARTQILYTADELQTAGINSGLISEIAFDISSVSSQLLSGYTVSIQTIGDSVLTTTIDSNWTVVYSGTHTITKLGWDTIIFNSPFEWNGTGNILLQICFDNTSYTASSNVNSTSESGKVLHNHSDGATGCTLSGLSLQPNRPNILFGIINNYQTDLAISKFTQPNLSNSLSPNASTVFGVEIINTGLAMQSTFDIKYSIDNGLSYVSETYNGLIDVGDTLNYTFTTTADLSVEKFYNFIGVVSLANDSNNNNDTIFEDAIVCSSMAGTYNIGNGKDYPDLETAIMAVQSCGISGPVELLLEAGTYDGFYNLNPIYGASAINTVTIKSQGDTAILVNSLANYLQRSIFKLDGAKHIIIENLVIESHQLNSQLVGIWLTNEADSNIIRNCKFNLEINNGVYGIMASSDNTYPSSGNNANSLLIENNTFEMASIGIALFGEKADNLGENNIIRNNTFINQSEQALYLNYQGNLLVSENNFLLNISFGETYGYGVILDNCSKKVHFNKNTLRYVDKSALQISNSSKSIANTDSIIISNNMITTAAGDYSSNYGISNENSSDIMYYNNTIASTGTNQYSAAFNLGSGSNNIEIKNNIFASEIGYLLDINVHDSNFVSNYNNFYSNDTLFCKYNYNDYNSLSFWQTISNEDANSTTFNPGFVSTDDLHISNSLLNNLGTVLSSVNYDIDGETRSLTNPDMGADEYTPPANDIMVLGYIGPYGQNCSLNNNETIKIIVFNNGTSSQTNIPLSYKVNEGTVVTENISSLAPLVIDTFEFITKVDLSAGGLSKIALWSNLTGDEAPNNDSLFVEVTNTLSISSFPFTEPFNENNLYFNLISNQYASIELIDDDNNSGNTIIMKGGNYGGWNYYGVDFTEIKNQNSSHEVLLSTCNIDANGLSNLRMSFDLEMFGYSSDNNWFWITANDTIITDINGDSIWNSPLNLSTIVFNLNHLTGQNFNLEFHGILNSIYDDKTTIDNIYIWELKDNDVGLVDLFDDAARDCSSGSDPLYAVIKNYGINSQTNFPISVIFNSSSNTNLNITYTDTIASGATDTVYVGTLDATKNELFNIDAFTSLSTDQETSNDSINITFTNFAYHQINHIDEFNYVYTYDPDNPDSETGVSNPWTLKNFFIQEAGYLGLTSNVLALDVYSQGAQNTATYDDFIGIIGNNSELNFDFKFVMNNDSLFTDTINFTVETCNGGTYTIFSINSTNYFNDNTWHSYNIPLNTELIGERVRIGVDVIANSQQGFFIAIDNYGITNPFDINLGNDTTICFGDSLLISSGLSSDSGFYSVWNGPNVVNDTTDNLMATMAGMYDVTVYDSYGNSYTDDITISYTNQITAIATTDKAAICVGDSAFIEINFTGDYPLIVNWSFDGNNLIDTTNETLSDYFDPIVNTDYYINSVTDVNGCSIQNADSINITVNSLPTISLSGLENSYCTNDENDTIFANPTGGYFIGLENETGIIDPTTLSSGALQIRYFVTDTNGCYNVDTITTEIFMAPTAIISTVLNPTYCQSNDSIDLFASPTGGTFTGSGLNGNKLHLNAASTGIQTYTYSYTDANGCIASDSVSTEINPLPIVTLANIPEVCADQNTLALTGETPTGGSYYGNAVATSTSQFYPIIAGTGNHNIIYSYTDNNGCTASANTNIKVVTVPSADFTINASICRTDTAIVTYNSNVGTSASFTWDFDNGTVVSGSGEGPYEVAYDVSGIKNLSLTVADSGCTSSTFQNYTNVLEAVSVSNIIGNDSACFGEDIIIFTNSGLTNSYQWFDTSGNITSVGDTLSYLIATTSGKYYVENTNANGCSATSNEVSITINPEIISSFNIPAIACKDDMVNINFNGTAGTTAQYNWDFDGGMIASGSNAGPFNIIWQTDSIKNVSLTVEEFGCISEPSENAIIIETTAATITALGNLNFCNGGSVSLSANAGPYSYEWFKDGITTNSTQAIYNATEAGVYTVEITNNNTSCSNISNSVVVNVNTDDFNIAFTANQTSFNIPPFNVNIANQTANANNYYWMWSFGDGNSSTFVNPTHQYNFDGVYSVGVIAQNVNTGCFDTLIKTNYISCTGGNADPCNLDASFGNIGGSQICTGDSVKLFANDHTTGVTYQWLRDGIILPGANDSVYYGKTSGLYQLLIADAICSEFSQPFSLTQLTTITPSIIANGSIQPCTNDSMELFVSTSFNSYQWSNGKVSPNIFVKTSGDYIVTITDNNGCRAESEPFVVNASLLEVPNICIVGIDSATNLNRVIWERENNNMIDSFRIYRESTVANVYDQIGSQAFSDLSIFTDVNSNPAQMAYRYRITAVDTCGMETAPSPIHKTLHLTINAGLGGVWNLIWTNYKGFTFGSYKIYRSSDSTNMQLLTQIQSNLTSYTDLNPPTGNVYYQIEIIAPHECYPDSIYSKVNTNYNTSRSNTANTASAVNIGIYSHQQTNVDARIYPNPNNGLFTFEIGDIGNNNLDLRILNTLGSEVYNTKFTTSGSSTIKQIDLQNLAKGVYFIRLNTKEGIVYRGKVIIN